MKPNLFVLAAIASLAGALYLGWHGPFRPGPGEGGAPTAAGRKFVTPLGVIPLKNGVRVTTDLHDGFVRTDSHDARFTTKFVISLSADEIEPFLAGEGLKKGARYGTSRVPRWQGGRAAVERGAPEVPHYQSPQRPRAPRPDAGQSLGKWARDDRQIEIRGN